MKAHARSLFFPRDLDTRRHRRAYNRRIKPAWRSSNRCQCAICVPWHVPGGFFELQYPRAHHLRLYALHLMAELAAFSPRLVGALAEHEQALSFFEGVELEVSEDDLAAARSHLVAMGYRVEAVREGERRGIEATGIEPVMIWSRRGPPRALGRSHGELEEMLQEMYGESFARGSLRIRDYGG